MIKGYTSGAMDLLHAGHILFLKACKEQCDVLVIGLHVDPSLEVPDKNKPIETLEERMIRLEGCKYVDEVYVYDTELAQAELLKRVKPDIRFKGGDHRNEPCVGHDYRLVFIPRDHLYASGNLRQRIAEAEMKRKSVR